MQQRLKTLIFLALPLQIVLVKVMGAHPQWIETYYSNGLYPIIAKGLRWLFGWIPFSVGDLLYLTVLVLAIRYIYLRWTYIKTHPRHFIRNVGVVLSLTHFAFYSLWGMNYYRRPIAQTLHIDKSYTTDELVGFTEYLAQQTNHYHTAITSDPEVPVQVPYSQKEIFEKTIVGYTALSEVYPHLTYDMPSLKGSLFSVPMSYLGNGGYLNPFSNEAQVNVELPSLRLLTVSGHEVGHQLGYSAEDDTTFIGLLAACHTGDPYYIYSAYHHALAYCLANLATHHPEKQREIVACLHPGVLKNFQELQAFWQAHKSPLAPLFDAIFNVFLKANNQKKGIKSYNAVVGLLIHTL